MTNNNLGGIQLAAALAEHVYRRSSSGLGDEAVTLSELQVETVELTPTGLAIDISETGTFYYSTHGFVGEAVQKDGILYVVFRGTDSAETFFEGAAKSAANGFNPEALDRSRESDLGDWATNLTLGKGTLRETQLDHALALTEVAQQYANAAGLTVQIIGQSLGGGLAGLVSMVTGLKAYAISPAPFNAQMKIEASIKAIGEVLGISRDAVREWLPHVHYTPQGVKVELAVEQGLRRAGFELADIITSNFAAITNEQIQQILNIRDSLMSGISSVLEIHTNRGEMLSDGLPGFGSDVIDGKFDVERTEYDLGANPSPTEVSATAASLHGPALHNLVIRTATNFDGVRFADLLKNDASLRFGLLQESRISGPKGNNRDDPYGGEYGGSSVASGSEGAHVQILYRVLWKSVGVDGGFYEEFTYNFGDRIASGAVGRDKDWVYNSTDNGILHAGFVFLGLQVVRDAISRDGTGGVRQSGHEVFSLDGLSGGIGIDIRDIHSSGGTIFGKDEINYAFNKVIIEAVTEAGLPIVSFDWMIAIGQNGEGKLIYSSNDSVGHIVFGGAQGDEIRTSSAGDYLYGGGGDDVLEGRGGADLIVGGEHGFHGDTVDYGSSNQSVSVRLDRPLQPQKGGDAEGDVLVGIENVSGSGEGDVISGNNSRNELRGYQGEDQLFGLGGNDFLDGGHGSDILVGGAGDDILVVGKGDKVYGGIGNDSFILDDNFFHYSNSEAIVDGGTDYDVAYISYDYFWQDEYAVVSSLGQKFNGIEQLRVGWQMNDDGIWEAGSQSSTLDMNRLKDWYRTDTDGNGSLPGGSAAQVMAGFIPVSSSVWGGSNLYEIQKASVNVGVGQSLIFEGLIDPEWLESWNHQANATLEGYWVKSVEGFQSPSSLQGLSGFITGNKLSIFGFVSGMASATFESFNAVVTFAANIDGVGLTLHDYYFDGSVAVIEDDTSLEPFLISRDSCVIDDGAAWDESIFNFHIENAPEDLVYTVTGEYSDYFSVNGYGQLVYSQPTIIFPVENVIRLTVTASNQDVSISKPIEIRHPSYSGSNNPSEPWVYEEAPYFEWLTPSSQVDEVAGASVAEFAVRDSNQTSESLLTDVRILNLPNGDPLLGIVEGRVVLIRDPVDDEIGSNLHVVVRVTDNTGRVDERGFTVQIGDTTETPPIDPPIETPGGVSEDDTIYGTSADDTIHGHAGNDFISGEGGSDELYGDAGDDTIYAYDGSLLDGGDGDDTLFGSYGDDILVGGAGRDSIYVGGGADRIVFSGLGDSPLSNWQLSEGGVSLPWGVDTVSGVTNDDVIDMTALGSLSFDPASDTSKGLISIVYDDINWSGMVTVDMDRDGFQDFGFQFSSSGNLTQMNFSGVGSYDIPETPHAPVIDWFNPYGEVYSEAGAVIADVSFSDRNEDAGNLQVEVAVNGVDAGNPLVGYSDGQLILMRAPLQAEIGIDFSGTFTVSDSGGLAATEHFSFNIPPEEQTIYGTASSDYIGGTLSDDTIYGLDGDDTISLRVGRDKAYGGNGDDYIYAGSSSFLSGDDGNDYLRGSYENDIIAGGAGADTLVGNAGADTFVFYSEADSPAVSLQLGSGSFDTTAFDYIQDLGATDIIDLTSFGILHFNYDGAGSSAGSTISVEFDRGSYSGLIAVDTDQDGLQDFAISFGAYEQLDTIRFAGVGDYLLA